jgi:hypothetical protein
MSTHKKSLLSLVSHMAKIQNQQSTINDLAVSAGVLLDANLKAALLRSVTESLAALDREMSKCEIRASKHSTTLSDVAKFQEHLTEAQQLLALALRVLTHQEKTTTRISSCISLFKFAQTTILNYDRHQPTSEELYYESLDCIERSHETKYLEVLAKLPKLIHSSITALIRNFDGIVKTSPDPHGLKFTFELLSRPHRSEPEFMSRPSNWDRVASKLNLLNKS